MKRLIYKARTQVRRCINLEPRGEQWTRSAPEQMWGRQAHAKSRGVPRLIDRAWRPTAAHVWRWPRLTL